MQPSQCYCDHTSGCFATLQVHGGILGLHGQQGLQVACSTTSMKRSQAPAGSSNSGAPAGSSVARRDEHELSCGRCTSSAPHRLPTCRLKTWRESGHCAENSICKWRKPDRKFGSHHHQRLRVTYRTASMGGPSAKRLPGFTTMPSSSSPGSRWEIQVRAFNEACM